MKLFKVMYQGSNTRLSNKFNDQDYLVNASNEQEAVEDVFQNLYDSSYFPQEDGSIKDCDGNIIRTANEDTISVDGGYLYAIEFDETEEAVC